MYDLFPKKTQCSCANAVAAAERLHQSDTANGEARGSGSADDWVRVLIPTLMSTAMAENVVMIVGVSARESGPDKTFLRAEFS